MTIKRIETISNEFVEQLESSLHSSFPKQIRFKVDYYIGEDSDSIRGLYIEIISSLFGTLYMRVQQMKNWETVGDVEDSFMNSVINDLVLAGISFLQGEAIMYKGAINLNEAIRAKKFKRMMPTVLISVN